MTSDVPKASQRRQRVRMVVSYLFFALCIFFLTLWAHSYKLRGLCTFGTPDFGFCAIVNERGRMSCIYLANCDNLEYPFQWSFDPYRKIGRTFLSDQGFLRSSGLLGFNVGRKGENWFCRIPHGAFVLIAALLAFLLKPKPRLKFSVIGLFLLTTSVAVAFGGVEALARLSG